MATRARKDQFTAQEIAGTQNQAAANWEAAARQRS